MNKDTQTTTQIIAKEGIKPILFSCMLVFLCIFIHLQIFALVFFILSLFFIVLFRNPERISKYRKDNAILSPCDGIIRDISINNNEATIKIEIGLFDVGILRTPMFVDSINATYQYGLFIKDDENLKEILNTKHCIDGIKDNRVIYSMKLFPEVWNKISIYEANQAFMGDRIGFMKYGYLVLNIHSICDIKVQRGDNVFAGQSLIAKNILAKN